MKIIPNVLTSRYFELIMLIFLHSLHASVLLVLVSVTMLCTSFEH